MLDLLKLTQEEMPWWSNDDERLSQHFRSGDAVRAVSRSGGIIVDNLIRKFREHGDPRIGQHAKSLDAECEIFMAPDDANAVILVNPNVSVLRDLICDSSRWQSLELVNSADYRAPNKEARLEGLGGRI